MQEAGAGNRVLRRRTGVNEPSESGPAHSGSQRADMCNMVATMPFVETKLRVQREKAHCGMAKRFGKRRGRESTQ